MITLAVGDYQLSGFFKGILHNCMLSIST